MQGNILLGQVILDTMQHTFLNTSGPLADRLMKTLEAAKIIGADTRCAVRNTSSQSAFIKVVRIGDGGAPYLQEVVPDSPVGVDPIGLLREQFDLWKQNLANTVDPFLSRAAFETDSLPANGTAEALLTVAPKNNADTLLAPGLEVLLSNSGQGSWGPVSDLGNGTYVASLTAPATAGSDTVFIRVVNGPDTVALAARPHCAMSRPRPCLEMIRQNCLPPVVSGFIPIIPTRLIREQWSVISCQGSVRWNWGSTICLGKRLRRWSANANRAGYTGYPGTAGMSGKAGAQRDVSSRSCG